MVKLDLDLVKRPAEYPGQPVPKELDLHIIKHIVGLRKEAVERNPSLITMVPKDHSDIFYESRTHLNQLGYDTSVYNDNVKGGKDRRKDFYSKIKGVCEGYYRVKRHQIGIFPEDRAVMAFSGGYYSVGLEAVDRLMSWGTDVIVVEKAGAVLKMVPYTKNRGIAFIQSQGFVSEYGVALAQVSIGDYQTADDFTNGYLPTYNGHLFTLVDCDSSGVTIGANIIGATRLGLDLESIEEIIEVNKKLGLDLTNELKLSNIVETNKKNSHWKGLLGVIRHNKDSEIYKRLRKSGMTSELESLEEYLNQKILDQNDMPMKFIDWLKTNRIELNTVLAIAKPEAFYNWLNWKLLQLRPTRNYNRVDFEPEPSDVYPPAIKRFIARLDNTIRPLADERYKPIEERLKNITGFIKNTNGTKKLIHSRISKQISSEANIRTINDRLTTLAEELNLAPI